MSACTRYPDDEAVLRYVTRDLGERDTAAFEDHLFACDPCLDRVERYQAATQVLSSREIPPPPVVVVSGEAAQATSSRRLPWWTLAMAAVAIVALALSAIWIRQSPPEQIQVQAAPASSPPSVSAAVPSSASAPRPARPADGRGTSALRVAVLAMVTPPPYLALTTRGAGHASFSAAMQAYTRANWADAARQLASIETTEARFYQGISDLMRGDARAAADALDAVRISGRQPYARESLFYLGKAALQRGDVTAARASLIAARDAGAGPGGEAARMLAALAELAN